MLFQKKEQYYYSMVEEFKEMNSKQLSDFDKQIFSQLNSYVKDFGEDNSYDVILGANGNGSVMYGRKSINLSDEVIKYINAKYQDEQD